MINFSNSSFCKSATNLREIPEGKFPEVLFVGKSNVGKSSLINALTNKKKLAFTSSKAGHTRLLNYFNIDDKVYFVDAPGYGYAKGGINLNLLFKNMMNEYISSSHLKLILFLLDSRRELSNDDVNLINYFLENNHQLIFVFTKADKINQKEKSALLKHLTEIGINKEEINFVSTYLPKSIEKLRKVIEMEINRTNK